MQRGGSQRGVLHLMVAIQSRRCQCQNMVIDLHNEAAIAIAIPDDVTVDGGSPGAHHRGVIIQRRHNHLILRGAQAWRIRPHDAGFLTRNAGKITAQKMFMITRNRGDDSCCRTIQNIC